MPNAVTPQFHDQTAVCDKANCHHFSLLNSRVSRVLVHCTDAERGGPYGIFLHLNSIQKQSKPVPPSYGPFLLPWCESSCQVPFVWL